jgi:hypothetical protein
MALEAGNKEIKENKSPNKVFTTYHFTFSNNFVIELRFCLSVSENSAADSLNLFQVVEQ